MYKVQCPPYRDHQLGTHQMSFEALFRKNAKNLSIMRNDEKPTNQALTDPDPRIDAPVLVHVAADKQLV